MPQSQFNEFPAALKSVKNTLSTMCGDTAVLGFEIFVNLKLFPRTSMDTFLASPKSRNKLFGNVEMDVLYKVICK